jgi:hypothetical protein
MCVFQLAIMDHVQNLGHDYGHMPSSEMFKVEQVIVQNSRQYQQMRYIITQNFYN